MMVKGKRLVFAELKSVKGKYSAEQNRYLQLLAATAAEVYRWRPKDWPEIERVLRGESVD